MLELKSTSLFTDKETEAPGGHVRGGGEDTCQEHTARKWQSLDLNQNLGPVPLNPTDGALPSRPLLEPHR